MSNDDDFQNDSMELTERQSPHRTDDDTTHMAMERICATIANIPFRGLVDGEHEPCTTDHPVDFLIHVADWLHRFRGVIVTQSDDFTRTAAKLRRMEDDREVIRSFFGTAGHVE